METYDEALQLFTQCIVNTDEYNDLSSSQLLTLLSRCPRIPNKSNNPEFVEKRYLNDFNNIRRRKCILALCDYIILSNKKDYSLLDDYIFVYLNTISSLDISEKLGNFIITFLSKLSEISKDINNGDISLKIALNIYKFYKQANEKKNINMITSFLSSLKGSHCPKFNEEQVSEIIKTALNIFEKSNKEKLVEDSVINRNIIILDAMSGLVQLKSVNSNDKLLNDLYSFGCSSFEEYIIPSLQLCLNCIEFKENYCNEVFKMICTELMYPDPLFEDNITENHVTYKNLINGLVLCSKYYPQKVRVTIQKLLDYLIDIYSRQSIDNNKTIRDEVINCLCNVIQNEMNINGGDSIKWVLDSLSHSLYTIYSEYMRIDHLEENYLIKKKRNENQLISIVVSIGRITCQLNNNDVSKHVVPSLINRISYPDLNFDAFIIEQLTEIALLGQKSIYSQIVDLLINIYKNCLNYPDNMFIHNSIPNAFTCLATGLSKLGKKDKHFIILKKDLLFRILKLFQLIANQIHKKEPKQRTAVLGFLGILLPVIGELMDDKIQNQIIFKDLDPSNFKIITTVWYYCVIYRFSYEKEWTQDWFAAIQKIAYGMPPLTSEKSTTVLETTLTLESLNMTPHDINLIKRELSEIISRSGQNRGFLFSQDSVKSMSFGKCVYLLSVYHLETIRGKLGNMLVLFSYLEEQSYRTDIAMSQAVTIIADQVFNVFLNEMNSKEYSQEKEDILIELIYTLLLAFVHNDVTVRKAADKYILELLDTFPQLLWNCKALNTLLDLTQAVGNGAEIQGHATLRVNLSAETMLCLPEDYVGRKALLYDISELCKVWLSSAKKYAPIETHSVLQEYCQQFQSDSFGFLHHQGFSLIIQMIASIDNIDNIQSNSTSNTNSKPSLASGSKPSLSSNKPSSSTNNPQDENISTYSSKQSPSSFVNSLNLKSAYLGEVGGMIQISKQLQTNLKHLEIILCDKIIATLQQLTTKNNDIDQNIFNGDLCRATALLISEKQIIYRTLLHYICWAPIVAYSKESIETGVFIWTWLLAARPDLSCLVMHEISDAWTWSIRHHVGLFNSDVIPPSPLSIQKTEENQFDIFSDIRFYYKVPSDPKPHCLLIDFLHERLTLIRKSNPTQMEIIQQILLNSIEDPEQLSQQPNSLSVRFRLLVLCTKFIQTGFITNINITELFLERIYNTAINWFTKSPMWYDPGSRQVLEDDVKVLIDFAVTIERVKTSSISIANISSAIPTENITQAGALIFSRVLDNFPSRDRRDSRNVDKYSHGTNTTNNASSQESNIFHYGKYRVSLLLLLIGHEIDRMAAWHNPQNRIKLKLPFEERYTTEKVIHGSQWRRFIKTAWTISPTLAVMLGERFPFPKVRAILSSYIVDNAHIAWTIPGAINYLATPENSDLNIPALTNLLYWATTTPPNALSLLSPIFNSHPYITQYAIRVLRSFPPDSIVFYIPQLVQTIRYDKSGLVEKYLLSASQHSQVLAHQLIWNLQTYTEDPEKTPYPLAEKASSLREQIISLFSDMFRNNYQNEFQFFETVTSISGILKPRDSKATQRTILKQKLKEIKVTPKLYLPTSPDTTVVAINPDKASPMQSAAKVPILVTFIVNNIPALDYSPPNIEQINNENIDSNIIINKRTKKKRTKKKRTPKRSLIDEKQLSPDIKNEAIEKPIKKQRTKKQRPTLKRRATMINEDLKNENQPIIPKKEKKVRRSTSHKSIKPSLKSVDESSEEESNTKSRRKKRKQVANDSNNIIEQNNNIPTHSQACIFKVGDDVRQDMLALQIVDLFKRILSSVGLDLFLYPYRVVATTPDCGIIECVPHAQSRDQIGKQVEGSLYDYFRHRYGPENSAEFQNARNNFLKSMAAYSVVSYILQIKDRHNGNMLIDDFGHIVHIDFGFIFDISPGGGLRFERAPFKMSDEMLTLMGGEPSAEPFKWFVEYTAKAYLACRQHMDSIITIVDLTLHTGFPCFTDQTLVNLKNRFCPNKSEKEAAKFIFGIIIEALSPFSSFTTLFYDVFQHYSNGIDY